MSESRAPRIKLDLEGIGSYELRRDNSALFTFIGHTAVQGLEFDNEKLDHVYVVPDEETEEFTGIYIFKSFSPKYQALAQFMFNNQYQAHLNCPDVPNPDVEAYQNILNKRTEMYRSEIPDFLPDNFS